MKKNTRSLLMTSLILFCAGLLLSLCASLYGILTDQKIFEVEKKERTIESTTVGIDEILANSPNSFYVKKQAETHFTAVDITSFAGNICICTGTEKAELALDKANTGNLKFEITGNTLIIEEEDPVGFFGFYIGKKGVSFKGLRHIFSPGNAINKQKNITLYLPNDTVLTKLNIDSFAGDIQIQGIDCESVNVSADYGNVSLSKLKNSSAKIFVSGSAGNTKITGCDYASCSINKKIGNIDADLTKKEGQSTVLDTWCGDVTVTSPLPVSCYKLNLSTNFGKVETDRKSFGKKHKENGSSASRISSNLFLGDVSISEK